MRDLDAKIAELIGKERREEGDADHESIEWFRNNGEWYSSTRFSDGRVKVLGSGLPAYSTDPAASHELRTWMRENGAHYELRAGITIVGATVNLMLPLSLGDPRKGWANAGHENECTALALAFVHAMTGEKWEETDVR